jgi:Secretion system C-terminal sorting domain
MDIQNLISQPEPCLFVGFVDYDNIECFDILEGTNWKYTWWIRSASDGELIASYDGLAFQHTFKKFGGYQFCLEIDKDGDPTNGPESSDCVTYTTCDDCIASKINIAYNSCPFGEGCDITLSANIPAQNDNGLKPFAKFILTYLPTPQELLGGTESYEIEYIEIPIKYTPYSDSIKVSQKIKIPFKRGCFISRLVLEMEDGFGAHGNDGIGCSEIELRSEEKFRCIACANKDGECIASEVASQISNEEDSCDPFYFCNLFRESEIGSSESQQKALMLASPNPAIDRVHIEFPPSNSSLKKIIVFNQIGQISIQQSLAGDETYTDLDVSALQAGLYFVKLMDDGKLESSTQLIIQR